jgi:hypothetical protein
MSGALKTAAVAAGSVAAFAIALQPAGAARSSDITPYDHFEFKYTSKKPNTRTGFRYRVRLHQNGDEQPPTVRELRLSFASGTRIDRGAVPPCAASDDELMKQGTAACKKASRLATGEAGVYIGTATPANLHATVFAAKGGVAVLLTSDSGSVIKLLRGKYQGPRTLVVAIPPTPLGNGKEAALVRFELDIAARGTRKRPWIRTPTLCTTNGWDVVYAPLFDPIGRVKLTDNTRCRPDPR